MKQGPLRNFFAIASRDQTAFDLDFQGRISFYDAISIRLEMGRGAVCEESRPACEISRGREGSGPGSRQARAGGMHEVFHRAIRDLRSEV
jgi:hypothetical protein